MYLKSLELQGFKSFPDKYKLEFDKGLTAVVGPNGSGKSNIGDAMRWVMGEQSTKNLRGSKMEDVIFSGTEKRKAVGFAQVTLNIDNSDRALDVESDIVSVSRKLYRHGDSEYMINGAGVRLKDISELLMDTGLGKDGYSIIGQGRIAEIVSGKSSDRREIFEEAAGISKFKYKKAEAERRLGAAEENILRLTDIISELESRVEPLRIQSEKAKKFRELDNEKRGLEISLWVRKLDELTSMVTEIDDKLLVLNGEYENLSRELDEIEELIEQCYADRAKTTENIEAVKDKVHQLELDNTTASSQIAVLENDIKHIENSIESIELSIAQNEHSKERIRKEIEEKTELSENNQKEIDAISREIIRTHESLENLSQKSDEFDKNVFEINSELNELYIKKSELLYKVENSKNVISDLEESISSAFEFKSETEQSLEAAENERKELSAAIDKAEEEITEHNNKLTGFNLLYKKRSANLDELKRSSSLGEMKIRELSQRLQILNDLENSMEGFTRSVRQVLRGAKTGQINGVHGSVAQIISVEPKYSLAIETALGGALQNVVVENEDVAKRCIRYLKDQNAGRATFLPLTSIKGSTLREIGLDEKEGFVDIASRLVRADERYKNIVEQLLGRIVIAEDIDFATIIAKSYGYKFRIVTLDGQVINAGGSFTGGSSSRSTGILTRKNEIEDINTSIKKLKADNKELMQKCESASQEVQKLYFDIEGEKELINLIKGDKIRFEAEYKRVCELSGQYKSSLDEFDARLEGFKQKLIENNNIIDNSNSTLSEISHEISEKEESVKSSQSKMETTKLDRQQLSEKLSQLKIREAELLKDKQAIAESLDELEKDVENSDKSKNELEIRISGLREEIDLKNMEISEIEKRLEGSYSVFEEYDKQIKSQQIKYNDLDMKAAAYRHEQKVKTEGKENVSKEITRATEKSNNIKNDYDKIIAQLWEQYELTRSDASSLAENIEDVSGANKRLNEIKSKIRNLGNVNLGAIEEYEEVSERYGFMSGQLRDVLKSKAELEEIIADLTENMRSIFTDNFNKINENFKSIFTELFGGGKGELVLTDPENVLESGIDINVAPPGKVIKNLSLLSGGEQAFVAICIYFAILKIRPSPFCLLDEIEAALDDVNVTRYAQYLRNFTDTTQFILITHRRGTMEEADVLYGVTMQEKGVSRLLKMNASDVPETQS